MQGATWQWILDLQTKQGTVPVEDVFGQVGKLKYGLHIVIKWYYWININSLVYENVFAVSRRWAEIHVGKRSHCLQLCI